MLVKAMGVYSLYTSEALWVILKFETLDALTWLIRPLEKRVVKLLKYFKHIRYEYLEMKFIIQELLLLER